MDIQYRKASIEDLELLEINRRQCSDEGRAEMQIVPTLNF